uniref:Integrase catalytic domain-containing protein n=2 Tax=Octopus bimaculoides TaxID=37653 RepID=A0A0L8HFT9_OCTBM
MVESFHHQLKAAIKAYSDCSNSLEHLPLILLGIQSTIKKEVGHTPAELVYGTALTLPEQMIEPVSPQDLPDPAKYVHRLRTAMSNLSPAAPRQQNVASQVPKDINTWIHVFVRNDGTPSQLQPPYSGPYKVLKKEPKYFVLDIGGKRNTVSVDRLKKAYIKEVLPSVPSVPQMDSTTPVNTSDSAQPWHTKLGRTVH